MTPLLVLTRPQAQSQEIAEKLGGGTRVVVSPVMRIEPLGSSLDIRAYSGLIFTSANALGALDASLDLQRKPTYCVGERTADAARLRGADVKLVALDAEDLVERLRATGPLLHMRGKHARGEIAQRLTSAGIETEELVVYRQVSQPLSAEALAALGGDSAVVLPLYSPRSARLVGNEARPLGSRVRVIAMSPAVAVEWRATTGGDAEVVAEPTGAAMLAAIRAAL